MTRRCMETEEYWRDLGGLEASNSDGPADQFAAAWKALTDAELVDMIRFCQGFAPPRPGGRSADDAPSPYTRQNMGLLDMIKQRARDFWAHREDARADLRSRTACRTPLKWDSSDPVPNSVPNSVPDASQMGQL